MLMVVEVGGREYQLRWWWKQICDDDHDDDGEDETDPSSREASEAGLGKNNGACNGRLMKQMWRAALTEI